MHTLQFQQQSFTPTKIVCVGRNYTQHIQEMNNEVPQSPIIFIKPNSAFSNKLHCYSDYVEYEAEISFLIQNKKAIAVALGLDLTKRKLQADCIQKGLPWEIAKAFDHSAVFSHFVPIPANPLEIRLSFFKNQDLVQQATLSECLFKPNTLMDYCGTFLSFQDGDILMTGTPKGVGPITASDHFFGSLSYQDKELLNYNFSNH